MSGFDIDGVLRWFSRLPKHALDRRDDADLPFVTLDSVVGGPVMLDTCVYIDQMQGKLPSVVRDLLRTRVKYHSTVVVQEMLHWVGRLDPNHAGTAGVVDAVVGYVRGMLPQRIWAPDPILLARASVLAGHLCRVMSYGADAKFKAVQDSTLFLQARHSGITVVTRNLGDFDRLLQLVPDARILLYRTEAGEPRQSK